MGAAKPEKEQETAAVVDESAAPLPEPEPKPESEAEQQATAPAMAPPKGCECGDAARIESYPATRPNGQAVTVTRCQRCGAHEVANDGK